MVLVASAQDPQVAFGRAPEALERAVRHLEGRTEPVANASAPIVPSTTRSENVAPGEYLEVVVETPSAG